MTTRTGRLSLAWFLAALLGAFVLVGGVLATDLKDGQKGTAWDAASFQGSADECASLDLKEGTALWHFVLTNAGASSGNLTVTFDNAGTVGPVANDSANGGNLDWNIVTDIPDTLLDASTDVGTAQSQLNLSHICANPGTPPGGGGGATEQLPAGTGTIALAIILLLVGGLGFLGTTNRLPKIR